jgi:hypothetical protein
VIGDPLAKRSRRLDPGGHDEPLDIGAKLRSGIRLLEEGVRGLVR